MKTLIHLVSEQTMQNLLPILAFRPTRVVQIRSRPTRFHTAANNLRIAVAEASQLPSYHDLHPEFIEETINEDSPSVEHARAVVTRHLEANPNALVNITGGTKLMSIGAYLAAEVSRQCARLYCDTSGQQFVPLGPAELPDRPPVQRAGSQSHLKRRDGSPWSATWRLDLRGNDAGIASNWSRRHGVLPEGTRRLQPLP